MKKDITVQVGPGFLSLLTILFIGLKLTGYITWSWWWVLAPIWIPVAFSIVVILFVLIGAVFGIVSIKKRKSL